MPPPAYRPAAWALAGSFACALALSGCASGPSKPAGAGGGRPAASVAGSAARDGADARPPPDLARVPDAEPRIEPVRPGGANKPYQALGRDYVPLTGDPPFSERGLASWYGRKFHGRRTSSGEPYDMYAMTAAHPTLPIPSYARVRNPANGREVVVRINDRGPFHSGRIVDLSYTAALKLDVLRGVAPVELERITFDEVRSGAWRRGGAADDRVAAAKAAVAAGAPVVTLSTSSPALPLSGSGWASGSGAGSGAAAAGAAGSGSAAAAAASAAAAAGSGSAMAAASAAAAPVAAASLLSTPPLAPDAPPTADGNGAAPLAQPSAGFYVQLGAFRERDGADAFQRRVLADAEWLSPVLAVFGDSAFFRLQAGPYPNRGEAARAADRMRSDLQLVPLIVERR